MWSVEYVQVPKEDSCSPVEEQVVVEETSNHKQRVHRQIAKQMSISAEFTANEEGTHCSTCFLITLI